MLRSAALIENACARNRNCDIKSAGFSVKKIFELAAEFGKLFTCDPFPAAQTSEPTRYANRC